MEGIGNILTGHQLALIAVLLVAVFIVYFVFKKLMSCLLISLLIFLAAGAYLYFQNPNRGLGDLWKSLRQTRHKTEQLVREGKDTYREGKDLVDKGKKLSEKVDRLLDGEGPGPRN